MLNMKYGNQMRSLSVLYGNGWRIERSIRRIKNYWICLRS